MSQGFTGQVNTNALNAPFFNGGRLTCASGQPVADASNAGTLYWTPYKSGTISLYNGTNYQTIIASETSLTLTGASSAASGSVYDVFGYLSGTVMVLESLVWTNTTTRATSVNQDSFGVYSKSTDRTRRYLGTFYASGTNQITDSTSIRGLWNVDNAEPRALLAVDTTDTWTYGTASWRAANNSSTYGVARVGFVYGLSLGTVNLIAKNMLYLNSGAASINGPGIGVDSTTALASGVTTGSTYPPAATYQLVMDAMLNYSVVLGFHYVSQLEIAAAGATCTFYGDAGVTYVQTGLTGTLRS